MPSSHPVPNELGEHAHPLFYDRNLLIIFSITLAAVMGTSSITPALPAITRAFAIDTEQVGWLVASFTLPGIVLTPVAGLLADRYGRRRVLVPSLVLFAVAGSACAFADDYGMFLLLRGLQGVGAASLGALNATLIGDIYSGNRRATAMGYNAAVISVGAAAYPLIGGALTLFEWRLTFALPLIALPIAFFVGFVLQNPEPERFDGLRSYLRKLYMSVGNAQVATMFFSGLVVFAILYGAYVTYLPFLLEQNFGTTSAGIGLVMAASAIGSAAAAAALGALMRRFSRKSVVLWSFAAMSVPVAVIPYAADLWLAVVATVIFGGAHGIALAVVQVLLAEFAPPEQRAAVMALNGMMFRIGQTIGPLMMGLFLVLGGMDAVFVGSALLGIVTTLMLWIVMPREGAIQ